jgi:DNA gyrase subunit A
MDVITQPDTQQVLSVCVNGYGKRTPVSEFRTQNRGGLGIIAIEASERNGAVVDLDLVVENDELMVITNRGQIIRTKVAEIRQASRNTQGVRIIRLEEGEQVAGVEPVAEPDDEAGGDSLRPTAVAGEATPAEGGAPVESAADADAPAADNPTEPA